MAFVLLRNANLMTEKNRAELLRGQGEDAKAFLKHLNDYLRETEPERPLPPGFFDRIGRQMFEFKFATLDKSPRKRQDLFDHIMSRVRKLPVQAAIILGQGNRQIEHRDPLPHHIVGRIAAECGNDYSQDSESEPPYGDLSEKAAAISRREVPVAST